MFSFRKSNQNIYTPSDFAEFGKFPSKFVSHFGNKPYNHVFSFENNTFHCEKRAVFPNKHDFFHIRHIEVHS